MRSGERGRGSTIIQCTSFTCIFLYFTQQHIHNNHSLRNNPFYVQTNSKQTRNECHALCEWLHVLLDLSIRIHIYIDEICILCCDSDRFNVCMGRINGFVKVNHFIQKQKHSKFQNIFFCLCRTLHHSQTSQISKCLNMSIIHIYKLYYAQPMIHD